MRTFYICLAVLFVNCIYAQVSLTPFSPNITHNHFGGALDAFGNEIVVTAANTMNMTQSKVFVFEKTALGIVQETYFTPTDGAVIDAYGNSVSIDNDFIAVGSPVHSGAALYAGAVYLYKKTAGTWQFTQKITAVDPMTYDYFGKNVEVYNNQLFVTVPYDENTGQPGDTNSGSVYVYNFDGTNWLFSQKLSLPSTLDFGNKIKVKDNKLIVCSSIPYGPAYLHTYLFDGSTWNFSNTMDLITPDNQSIEDFAIDNSQLFVLMDANSNYITTYDFVSNNWTAVATLPNLDFENFIKAANFDVKNDIMFIGFGPNLLLGEGKSPVAFYKKTGGNWVFQQVVYGNGPAGFDDMFGATIVITDQLIACSAPYENYPVPFGKAYLLDPVLGVPENNLDNSVLYPNPTHDMIRFSDTLYNNLASVEIYQLDGKLLKRFNSAFNTISLKEYPNGVYLLKMTQTNHTVVVKKIVKE